MQLPDEKELSFYDRHGVARPSHLPHGVTDTYENPLSEQLKSGNPRNFQLRGNELYFETDFGPMTQRIPPNYILTGVDKKGLPTFKKLL